MLKTMQFLLVGTLAGAAGAATLAAPAQDRPGMVSQARVFVENRNLAEAIPVSVQEVRTQRPLTVQIDQSPPQRSLLVQVDGSVLTRELPQQWEYTSADARTPARITELGTQGWEAVGVVTAQQGVTILFKRPKT